MQLGVLVTNHGKHSDAKLGFAVASDIVQVGADAASADAFDARKLQDQIADIATGYFAKLSAFEHGELAVKGNAHLATELVAHPEIMNGLVTDVCGAIAASPFVSWWSAKDTSHLVRVVAEKWLKSGHHMHRDWAAKGKIGSHTNLTDIPNFDPNCQHVKNWTAAQVGA